jgi:hypothetical protein
MPDSIPIPTQSRGQHKLHQRSCMHTCANEGPHTAEPSLLHSICNAIHTRSMTLAIHDRQLSAGTLWNPHKQHNRWQSFIAAPKTKMTLWVTCQRSSGCSLACTAATGTELQALLHVDQTAIAPLADMWWRQQSTHPGCVLTQAVCV